MIRTKTYIWTVAMLVAVAFAVIVSINSPISFAQVSGSGSSVVVCNVVSVFNDYDRAKDLSEDFRKRSEAITHERDKRAARIKAMQQELEGLEPGSDDYESILQNVQREAIEAEAWQQYKMTLAARDHHRLTTEMYEEILKMVQVIAEQQGYTLVLFREGRSTQTESLQQLLGQVENRKVLYNSPRIDITQIVLGRLNQQYHAGR
jgi:Skp family chaperone for outer membrane proteins